MLRIPPLKNASGLRKFGSVGSAYPRVVSAVVMPAVLKIFPLLRAKFGGLRMLKTSALTRKYFPSATYVFLATDRFSTLKPGASHLFRPTVVLTPRPPTTYLDVGSSAR